MKKSTQVNKANTKNKIHVKEGDNVIVISGDCKVIVEKVNMVKKHVKPRKQGDKGGIIEAEAAMYASKVQHFCSSCKKPTRVAH